MSGKSGILRVAGLVCICFLFVLSLAACGKSGTPSADKADSTAGKAGGDIVINKSDVTEQATFIPYEADGAKMEVIAVLAPDGTVRTAFNTCQVCFDSGRGYYKQEGDELVCQNCGNRFNISKVEKQKNGCNPVPILDGDKKDDGKAITISADFLAKNKDLFANWKTR